MTSSFQKCLVFLFKNEAGLTSGGPAIMLLFSLNVMSNTLQHHGLACHRLLCLPLSPGVCSNSCPLSRWCYLTVSSSAVSFSFCLQSCASSGSFLVSWLFTSGGQSIEASASASVLPLNIQGSVVSDSLQPHGLGLARLFCPWNSPGKNTGAGCHFLLQEIFPTQGLNSYLLHCRQIL